MRTNVCGREDACEQDEGEEQSNACGGESRHMRGGGEDKFLGWRERMREG